MILRIVQIARPVLQPLCVVGCNVRATRTPITDHRRLKMATGSQQKVLPPISYRRTTSNSTAAVQNQVHTLCTHYTYNAEWLLRTRKPRRDHHSSLVGRRCPNCDDKARQQDLSNHGHLQARTHTGHLTYPPRALASAALGVAYDTRFMILLATPSSDSSLSGRYLEPPDPAAVDSKLLHRAGHESCTTST